MTPWPTLNVVAVAQLADGEGQIFDLITVRSRPHGKVQAG
jgi:hypothetical protein